MVSPLSPSDIRSIRRRLNLSQADAGEVIGGGPRAFQKYESGTVRPSASVVRLLRLLDENPAALGVLRGEREAGPFEVDGGRLVGAIPPQAFPSLLRRLLSAEAQAHGLPQDGIHVAAKITAADDGEDGRIEWTDGPDRTTFLPARLCQFQLKTGPVFPASSAKEVVGRTGQVKPLIRDVLDRGGHYILLCTQAYTQKQIQARKGSICTALRNAGMEIDEDRIDIRAAEELAHWINHYPSVAIWLNEQTGIKTVGPFRSWEQWRQRTEHETSSWVEDDRLPALQEPVRAAATQLRRVVRVVGVVGIGKSRLALEALAPSAGAAPYPDISDLVMYADLAASAPEEVNRVVQSLVDKQQRAVAVVDNCPQECHRILAGFALQSGSRVSLISIDYEAPPEMQEGVLTEVGSREVAYRLPEASSAVVEKVIRTACPALPSEDFRRLARVSQGNPEIALKVAQAWTIERPVAHATDEDIAELYVAGRQTDERGLLLKAARLLAAFQLVALDADQDDGCDDLEEVASFGRRLAGGDLRSMFERMIDRGAARRRGRFVTIEPRAIAVHLAAWQWREWNKADRRAILGGEATSPALKVHAAKQLAFLNDTEMAQKVVRDVCGPGGPFDGRDGLLRSNHAEVLHWLAQIDPSSVADRIERSFDEIADLRGLSDEVRRELVWTLEKIAFAAESFDAGARLLLRLALAETEPWENNATGQFKALFPVLLGNTAANGDARLELLDELCGSNDPEQRRILVEALIDGTRVDRFSRSVGAEIHGARPALQPWHPPTQEAIRSYLEACVTMLAGFASGAGALADIARKGLGNNLNSLASHRFIDLVEQAVETVAPHCNLWPEARDALGRFLTFGLRKLPDDELRETQARIQSLLGRLEPQSLSARARAIVTGMPWEYLVANDRDEDFDMMRFVERQEEAVREFAMEMLRRPHDLREILPDLARLEAGGDMRRRTSDFGRTVAEGAAAPLDWRDSILDAVLSAPDGARDFDLLAGYVSGLPEHLAAEAEAVKQLAAANPALAPGFPNMCWRRALVRGEGIVEEDVARAILAVEAGLLHPRGLAVWGMGGALNPLEPNIAARLFDALLDHSPEGYETAIHLIGMYVLDRIEALEGLRLQLVKAADNLVTQRAPSTSDPMLLHHFRTVMTWLLDQGRDDADARSAAMALSSALVAEQDHDFNFMMEDLVRPLLEGFPEISWQILGGGILAKGVVSMRLRFLLGKGLSERQGNPPILCLPEEVLFAWCRANGDEAAAFAAETLPFLDDDGGGRGAGLHPWMSRLIQEFGDRARVRQALDSNIFSGGFGGSASSFFGRYKAALASLRDGHSSSAVTRWAGKTLQALSDTGEQYDRRDDEWNAQNEN